MIIILNGSGTSGKDTFVEIVKELVDYPTYNLSTIDKVKEIAPSFGWDGGKEEKDRQFLSDLKDAWVRYCDGSYRNIVERVNNIISNHRDGLPYIIFIHSREPVEIGRFKNLYNSMVLTMLIQREDVFQYSNHADSNVAKYNYDVTIENNGTIEDLKDKAITFLYEYLGELYEKDNRKGIIIWLRKVLNLDPQKTKEQEDKK